MYVHVSVWPGSPVWEGFHRRLEPWLICEDVSPIACTECRARSQDWYPIDMHTVSFHGFLNIWHYLHFSKGLTENNRMSKPQYIYHMLFFYYWRNWKLLLCSLCSMLIRILIRLLSDFQSHRSFPAMRIFCSFIITDSSIWQSKYSWIDLL